MSEAKRVCAADSRQRQRSIRVRAGNFESAKTSTYSLADDTGLNDGLTKFELVSIKFNDITDLSL